MELKTPVSKIFMVGPTYAKRLERLKIKTVEDLISHFPFRYDDLSLISPIARVQPGETVTIRGEVISIKNEYTRGGKKIQKGLIADQSGEIETVWFNQPFLIRTIKVGEGYSFSGKIDWFGRKIVMVSPQYEVLKSPTTDHRPLITKTIHTGRLVPVYPETARVSSKWLRSRIAPLLEQILPELDDFLPTKIKRENNLLNLAEAIKWIHFPENKPQAEKARERLAFNELFLIQLASLKRKKDWQEKELAHQFSVHQEKILEFLQRLPFALTEAQKRCVREILNDLTKNRPMNRLLEGDVGSGKTVVAAIAAYVSFLNGFQTAVMAPTEILAQQHYQTLSQFLSPLGVKISLLTGSSKSPITNHQSPNLVIGTHALIHRRARFVKLGFVIIDEQHRFGVVQRAQLMKKGKTPHLLTMTATPIPRTIALTLYGDLDLSVLDQMPPGRKRVKTWVVPPQKREAAYDWIKKRVKHTDEQAFIICPLIEESETLQSVKAATVEYQQLSQKVFPDLQLGLLHGRMKTKEKDRVIERFRQGKLDLLVSTPVVEVGIDIPQATVMMIEGADRFGLAQLHQLRGRVGRGTKESFCLLFTEVNQGRAVQRLKAMEKTFLGMKLAELDLKLRGPGEIYGTKQHGFPDLRVASFTDLNLIKKSRCSAEKIVSQLRQYPLIREKLEKQAALIEPN
jgi:ATP-dependent DNA helicase RecG